MQRKTVKSQQGFTLVELIVVLAIVTIVASMGFGAYKTAQSKNQTALIINTIAFDLRRAQIQSQAVDADSSWGVKVQPSGITVFEGSSYATRILAVDEDVVIPASFTFEGMTEVVFTKFYGLPQSAGSLIVHDPKNVISTITINSKGTVSY